MLRIAIVGIRNMTRRASRRTIIARVIVCAEKIKRRIKQAGFLQSEIYGISALGGTKTTGAQSLVRLARVFVFVGQAGFQTSLSAPLENSQSVSRL